MNITCRAAGILLLAPISVQAAFTFNDIDFWVGSGDSQAALVIDWNDGATTTSYAWGYRWDSAESRTGADLFLDVVEADPRLTSANRGGESSLFLTGISFDPDATGSIVALSQAQPDVFVPDEPFPFFNYFVNNEVFNDPDDFANNSHVLPPNGEPYAADAPGTWISSSTGPSGRPLANGSYDGWSFGVFGTLAPGEPLAASAVPEPSSAILALLVAPVLLRRRRCA